MKKIVFIFSFLFFHAYFCNAQPPSRTDRIEAIKMAFITREVNLTPREAQRFWPVYNSYSNEINRARQEYPNDVVAFEDRVVNIRKRYQNEFRRVLNNNDERVNQVFTVENNYNDLLRNELQKRQQMRRSNNNRPPQ
jgi:Skp family chaperone for outer membrane proteins